MKKVLKFTATILLSVMLILAVGQPVISRADSVSDITKVVEQKKNDPANGDLTNIAQTVVHWIWVISIIVAIIVVMIVGIKFIIGSAQEKAEYKKSLMPLVVGVALVVFATTIVRFLFGMGN